MATSGNSSGTGKSVRNYIPMANKYDRIVVLVDMDCFYCQVEEKLNPTLRGKPVAVVQYNAWRGGGIIAVNYAARAMGVTRHMRGDEASLHCPDIVLVKVPNVREKADLTKYRDAGKEVANVLQRFTKLLERASVDEAYLDITDSVNERLEAMSTGAYILQPEKLHNTYAVGYENFGDYVNRITARFINPHIEDEDDVNFVDVYDAVTNITAVRHSDLRMLLGASIAGEIRASVKTETGYECSAGIAHNKILAKLACGVNKPNKQTLLPLNQISMLFEKLSVSKITGLGGKFGEDVCERLKIHKLGQLVHFTKEDLQKKFDEKNGSWLYNICRGIDLEAVTPRFYSKSIGCCKKFPGRNSIHGINTLNHWLNELAKEIYDRLEKDIVENNRRARQMVVSYVQNIDGEEIASSRSVALSNYDIETMMRCGLDLIKSNTKQFFRVGSKNILNNEIRFLGFSVGKFETIPSGLCKLQEMFANQIAKNRQTIAEHSENVIETHKTDVVIQDKEFKHNNAIKETEEAIEKEAVCEALNQKQQETKSFIVKSDISTLKKDATNEQKSQVTTKKSKSFFHNTFLKQPISVLKPEETKAVDDEEKHSKNQLIKQLQSETTEHLEICALDYEQIQNETGTRNQNGSLVEKLNEQFPIEDRPAQLCIAMKRKYTTTDEPDESVTSLTHYETAYAEYAIPEFRPELLQYVKCNICHANILSDERAQQTHQDEHFAQQLSHRQRLEYREEIKAKIIQNNKLPTTQKATKKNKKTPLNNNANITKFLKPKTATSLERTLTSNCEMNICEICDEAVKKADIQEHKDYHMAKKLHNQLNQATISKDSSFTEDQLTTQTQSPNVRIASSNSIINYFSKPKA